MHAKDVQQPLALGRVENQNWLVLVSLIRWRTNRKIIYVSNRPVTRCSMSQGAPVSPTPRVLPVHVNCSVTLLCFERRLQKCK